MIDKIRFTSGSSSGFGAFLVRFTSGRSVFWLIDLRAFYDFGFLNKLAGNGFDYIYYVNKTFYNMEIWAHNDIINLLLSVGLIGTSVYLFVIGRMIKNINVTVGKRFPSALLISYVVFPALINGFFMYQHYLYSFVILAIFIMKERDVAYEKNRPDYIS
jgi:hypothetical protein